MELFREIRALVVGVQHFGILAEQEKLPLMSFEVCQKKLMQVRMKERPSMPDYGPGLAKDCSRSVLKCGQ